MGAGDQKMLKNLFQTTWKTESAKSISELYTDNNKTKYSSNPKDFAKKNYEKFTSRGLYFLAKFPIERKFLMKNLTFARQKYL